MSEELQKEIKSLKKKLVESEARIISRCLSCAKEILNQEVYAELEKSMNQNHSLDLLKVERAMAGYRKEQLDIYTDLFEAVDKFIWHESSFQEKQNKPLETYHEDVQSHTDSVQKEYQKMIIYREKMRSLVKEIKIKKSVQKDIINL